MDINDDDVIIQTVRGSNVAVDDQLVDIIKEHGGNILLCSHDRARAYNVLEWALVATVALFLAKPFFEKFMGKLGDAAGDATVSVLSKQFRNAKLSNERIYSETDFRRLSCLTSESEKALIGRRLAPLEINVAFGRINSQMVYFRMVFPAGLDEVDFVDAFKNLSNSYEVIFASTLKYDQAIVPIMFGHERTVTLVYVLPEKKWMHCVELVGMERDKQS